jgi:hypothetical protein
MSDETATALIIAILAALVGGARLVEAFRDKFEIADGIIPAHISTIGIGVYAANLVADACRIVGDYKPKQLDLFPESEKSE